MQPDIVYLIRHSNPIYNVDEQGRQLVYGPESQLSDEGKIKAGRLAQNILRKEGSGLHVLVSSPYERTLQTAQIIGSSMNYPPIIQDPRLRDTDSLWPGVPVEEFLKVLQEGKAYQTPRTLETLEQLDLRMSQAYAEIAAQYAGLKVGIISHGDPLRVLYYRLLNPEAQLPPYNDLVSLIDLAPAEGARLEFSPFGVRESELISNQENMSVRRERG